MFNSIQFNSIQVVPCHSTTSPHYMSNFNHFTCQKTDFKSTDFGPKLRPNRPTQLSLQFPLLHTTNKHFSFLFFNPMSVSSHLQFQILLVCCFLCDCEFCCLIDLRIQWKRTGRYGWQELLCHS